MSEDAYYKESTSFKVIGFYEESDQRYCDSFLAKDATEAQIRAVTQIRIDTDGDDRLVTVAVANAIGAIVDPQHYIGNGTLESFGGIAKMLSLSAKSVQSELSGSSQKVLEEMDFLADVGDDSLLFPEDEDSEQILGTAIAGMPLVKALLKLAREVRDIHGDSEMAEAASAMVGYLGVVQDHLRVPESA